MVFGFILAYAIFLVYLKRYRRKYASSMVVHNNSSYLPKLDVERGVYLGLHIFSYDDLQRATNDFDIKKKLGDGGFGTVYYGKNMYKLTFIINRMFTLFLYYL